jgi:hypothetical protein
MLHHRPALRACNAVMLVSLLTVSIPVAVSQTAYMFTASYASSETSSGGSLSSSLVNQSIVLPYDGLSSGPFQINTSTSCLVMDGGFNDWEQDYSGSAIFADVTMLVQDYGEGRVAARCLWTTNNPVTLEGFGFVFLKANKASTPVSGQHWPYPFKGPCANKTSKSCYPSTLDVVAKGPSCTTGVNCPPAADGSESYSWDLDGPLPVGHPVILALVMNVTGTSLFCQIGQNNNVVSMVSCSVTLY